LAFLESAKGGGGIAKCYPMAYVQGNFTNYHLSAKEEEEEVEEQEQEQAPQ